jgi:hypothetical protein
VTAGRAAACEYAEARRRSIALRFRAGRLQPMTSALACSRTYDKCRVSPRTSLVTLRFCRKPCLVRHEPLSPQRGRPE